MMNTAIKWNGAFRISISPPKEMDYMVNELRKNVLKFVIINQIPHT
jgi:hypothetical protein